MIFNSRPLVAKSLDWLPERITEDDYPEDDWKYASFDVVYEETNDFIREILDSVPLVPGFKRNLVDLKVQNLTPDRVSCIPGWHLDGAFEDVHHLIVINGPGTEFISEPLEIASETRVSPVLAKMIPDDIKFESIPERTIMTFSGTDFHRGVRASKPTQRLLVRVSQTNSITASNRPRKPTVGARR